MNVERILQLADVIEKTPHRQIDENEAYGELSGFNMDDWHCGTVGCIGGWAKHLFRTNARLALDLDANTGTDLFYPENAGVWSKITPARAAAVLRNLAATGEVDWTIAP